MTSQLVNVYRYFGFISSWPKSQVWIIEANPGCPANSVSRSTKRLPDHVHFIVYFVEILVSELCWQRQILMEVSSIILIMS